MWAITASDQVHRTVYAPSQRSPMRVGISNISLSPFFAGEESSLVSVESSAPVLLWNSHLILVLSEKESNFSFHFCHMPLKSSCICHLSNSEFKKHTAMKMNRRWGQLHFMDCRNQMEISVPLLRPLGISTSHMKKMISYCILSYAKYSLNV